jgi:hypothetical protein
MRSRTVRLVGFSVAVAATSACSLLVSDFATPRDEQTGDAAPADAAVSDSQAVASRDGGGADATTGPTDASGGTDASDGGTGSGACPFPSLLKNASFENGTVGWVGRNGTISTQTLPRTGTGSLRVCRSSVSEYGGEQRFSPDLPSARYHGRAWFHRSPDGGTPNVEVYFTDPNGSAFDSVTIVGQIGPDWVCGEIDRTMVVHAFGVGAASSAAGTCTEVDDVDMFAVPASGVIPPECLCPP